MQPGGSQTGVAANPPGGDLYFGEAAALASPGEQAPAGAYTKSQGTTGHADQLETAPLAFNSESTSPTGEAVPLASNASKGHVAEVLNFRGSPAPWIGIALLLLFGLLVVSAEVKAKAGKAAAGAGIVL
jgi:hypothetical protein